jgi:hypothetical protein
MCGGLCGGLGAHAEASCVASTSGGLGGGLGWWRPRARRASEVGSVPVRGEFQAGSCSVEALSLSGGIGVARVGACGSDGVELGLTASRSGGVSVG